MLQWVHGPITVVIAGQEVPRQTEGKASMGPRSDNRGYLYYQSRCIRQVWLQWVHGPITVVIYTSDE